MEKFKLEFINRVRKHWLLRNVILSSDVLDFIASQFALESNYGTSDLAIKQRNFCGMKVPYRRCFYGYDLGSEFAYYDSFDSCCLDYVSWIFFNRPLTSELSCLDDFIRFLLNSGYCPEKDYISKIQSIYSQLKTLQNV